MGASWHRLGQTWISLLLLGYFLIGLICLYTARLHIREYEEEPPSSDQNGENHHGNGNGGNNGHIDGSTYPGIHGPTYPNAATPENNV